MLKSILQNIANQGVYLKVFPYDTDFASLAAWNPDGYFLSNGPGDPEPLHSAKAVAKEIIDKDLPLFGICLGHQVVALANGVSTFKMFNGHRGINHPVLNHSTGKGKLLPKITVLPSIEKKQRHILTEISHTHLNDNTVAGLKMKSKKCFSVQYHQKQSQA